MRKKFSGKPQKCAGDTWTNFRRLQKMTKKVKTISQLPLVDELLNKRGHRFEALVLDFSDVKITGTRSSAFCNLWGSLLSPHADHYLYLLPFLFFADLSGMIALKETMSHTRGKKIKFVLIHVRKSIFEKLEKFGITSDVLYRQRIDMRSTGGQYHAVTRPSEINFYSGIRDEEDIKDEEVGLLRSHDALDRDVSPFAGQEPGSDDGAGRDVVAALSGMEIFTKAPATYGAVPAAAHDGSLRNSSRDTIPAKFCKPREEESIDNNLPADPLARTGLRSRSRDDPHTLASAAILPPAPERVGSDRTMG